MEVRLYKCSDDPRKCGKSLSTAETKTINARGETIVVENPSFLVDYDETLLLYNYCYIPKHIIDKYKNGIIKSAHFADIIRTCLLYENGGLWIDATIFVKKDLLKMIYITSVSRAITSGLHLNVICVKISTCMKTKKRIMRCN